MIHQDNPVFDQMKQSSKTESSYRATQKVVGSIIILVAVSLVMLVR